MSDFISQTKSSSTETSVNAASFRHRVTCRFDQVARSSIHPIVLRDGNILVAGERRLAAHKLLGWDKIEYRMFSDLRRPRPTRSSRETSKRRDLSWKDECRAMWDYHQLRVRETRSRRKSKRQRNLPSAPGADRALNGAGGNQSRQ